MKRPSTLGTALAAAGALLATGLAGCSTVDSGDLRTSGIEATITGIAGSQDVDVHVYLGTGGLSSVHLEGDDALVASSGGEKATLHEDTFLGTRDYEGSLPVDPTPGTSVTVALDRGDADTDAPHSTVELPAAMRVTSPSTGSTFRRSRDLTLGVNRAPGSYEVTWSGSCVEDDATPVDVAAGDPVVVPAGSLVPVQGQPRSCAVTFHVARVVSGQLDDAYKSGGITAERTASVALTVRP